MNPNAILYEDKMILVSRNVVGEVVHLNKLTDTQVRIIAKDKSTAVSIIDGKGGTALVASITDIEEGKDREASAS